MWSQLGSVTHTLNSSTQGAETGRSLLETNPDFDLQSDFQDSPGYIVRSGFRGKKERWSHQIDAVPLSRFYFFISVCVRVCVPMLVLWEAVTFPAALVIGSPRAACTPDR